MRVLCFHPLILAFAVPAGIAQAPGAPIGEQEPHFKNAQIFAAAGLLREAGALKAAPQEAGAK